MKHETKSIMRARVCVLAYTVLPWASHGTSSDSTPARRLTCRLGWLPLFKQSGGWFISWVVGQLVGEVVVLGGIWVGSVLRWQGNSWLVSWLFG